MIEKSKLFAQIKGLESLREELILELVSKSGIKRDMYLDIQSSLSEPIKRMYTLLDYLETKEGA